MGGYGSGGHNVRKSSTGYCPRIDSYWFKNAVPMMCKKNIEEKQTTIDWDNGARVNLLIYQDRSELDYRFNLDGYDEWTKVREAFYFSRSSNNYGGDRLYFVCPSCRSRFRFLYIRSGYFRCRYCNKLNYPSSRKGKYDIHLIKIQSILQNKFKIKTKDLSDITDYIPDKPKGMHWETYYKWLDELEKAQEEHAAIFLSRCYAFGMKYL